jgi:hypothetical protein
MLSLDTMREPEHRVRQVWAYAQACDLTSLYQRIQAVDGTLGRNAVDPRLPFALWLFTTIQGVSRNRKPCDSEKMAAFQVRMGSPQARAIYKTRGGIVDFPVAIRQTHLKSMTIECRKFPPKLPSTDTRA